MKKQLRDYQTNAINTLASKYRQGVRRMIFQLPTGGGKTISASGLIDRYLQAYDKKVLFAVHREELLKQFRKTLYRQHDINAYPVTANIRYANPASQVYVAMIETACNRLARKPQFFGNVGLLIIDEAHLGNFFKIHKYFPNSLIIGLTATPISSNKKLPLINFYDDIVCGTDIPDLIKEGSLCQNKTYVVRSVDRTNLAIKDDEFDIKKMGEEFGKSLHIENCIKGYERYAIGTKTLVFNVDIEHSKLVTEAFIERGYNARHLDGTMKEERASILKWYAETPDAILNNVGILTAGFDEPTIRTVIMNRATKSLTLWLQVTGRGSRPLDDKKEFTIIDMGGNALVHGDWSQPRDWDYIFRNPPKKSKKEGVAPVKVCVNEKCEALISNMPKTCPYCNTVQPSNEEAISYDEHEVEFELLNASIDLHAIFDSVNRNNYNPYAALHQIKATLIRKAREIDKNMTPERAYLLLEVFQSNVAIWCKENSKKYNHWHKTTTAKWFFDELHRVFGYERKSLSLSTIQ